MTKEEILDAPFKRCRDGETDFIPISEVHSAMDTYAKQVAIGFAEWCDDNDFRQREKGTWENLNGSTVGSQRLYELYLLTLQPLTNETGN